MASKIPDFELNNGVLMPSVGMVGPPLSLPPCLDP